ncbi:unnamed protein product [Knipowitschia caucasica]|uniref:Protein phosphatase 1 regulatory subunit 19 n=1 Tax=Knipowitschia caucasica TaxID=637954 RepID=A0AAV2L5Q9_KNICA
MSEKGKMNGEQFGGAVRLREEHEKVVKDCESRIDHWKKVSGDYEALNDRLKTLPDKLAYDIMVPFGPLAFMPGKLVHTNEVTVLLGDNWFAKCSAKQAQKIVDHRMKHVKHELDELTKTVKNFEARVGFAKDLETMALNKRDYVDIREDFGNNEEGVHKGKRRIALKPKSKPKLGPVIDLKEEDEEDEGEAHKSVLSEQELWARLDELEKLEQLQDEQDRLSDTADTNGEDTSSSSSEEEKDGDPAASVNAQSLKPSWTTEPPREEPSCKDTKDDDEEEEVHSLPTIAFSHTVEPKKVRINTGKNTTLKYSERKEQKDHSKKKKKNGHSNGHLHPEHYKITTPADLYRLFVDVKNGEPVPRKSILKSRSRENSVCSDTSESSAADFEERRMMSRSFSHDDNTTHSDTSDGVTEEDSPAAAPAHQASRFEAFSATVIEKDPMPTTVPHLTIAHPALPTILERKQEEVGLETSSTDCTALPPPPPPPQPPQPAVKKLSKFKAARLQQM